MPMAPPIDLPAGPSEVMVIADNSAWALVRCRGSTVWSRAWTRTREVILVTFSKTSAFQIALRAAPRQLTHLPAAPSPCRASSEDRIFIAVLALAEAVEISNR